MNFMLERTIEELNEIYNLELEKVISLIKKEKAKRVLLQFPDGLKPYATAVVDYLEEKIKGVQYFIWMESCFGACDTPVLGKDIEKEIDLMIQFGHNEIMPGY
jgi:2-(3-amino-3-carboxypropyl)histidine synthase